MASFNTTLQDYETDLQAQRQEGKVELLNDNFDTGALTGPGDYPLADKTYGQLLDELAANHFRNISPEIRRVCLTITRGPIRIKTSSCARTRRSGRRKCRNSRN